MRCPHGNGDCVFQMEYVIFSSSFFQLFPMWPTCPPALPVNQSTVSHVASCVIVTALLQALPHDPSVLLTSFTHKPCFRMVCPGHPLQNCCALCSLGLSQSRHSLTAHGLTPLQPHPLLHDTACCGPASGSHYTAPVTLWSGSTHSCFGAQGNTALLVFPTAASSQGMHTLLGWPNWVVLGLLCTWPLSQVLGHTKTGESRSHVAVEEPALKQVSQQT